MFLMEKSLNSVTYFIQYVLLITSDPKLKL